jgi:Sensors of blue-light using FAD
MLPPEPSPIPAAAGIYQMAYCSVLVQPLGTLQVDQLVHHAQSYNANYGITGMLMMDNGLVVQWLEGPHDEVRSLWKRLQVDKRHHCVVMLLHRDHQAQRLFPDWTMRLSTRAEMLAIVHNARTAAISPNNLLPNPWAAAISTLCVLIDPEFAKGYAAVVQANTEPPHAG